MCFFCFERQKYEGSHTHKRFETHKIKVSTRDQKKITKCQCQNPITFHWQLLSFQQLVNVLPDFFRDKAPWVTLDRCAGGRDQELFKVPRNVGAFDGSPSDEQRICHKWLRVVMRSWESRFEPIKNRMGSFSIHQAFLHKHQLWFVTLPWSDMFQILQNLIPIPVFLMAKLIAGKTQDNELLAKLIGKCVHLEVIPGGRASQRSDVLNKDGFALEHIHLQLGSRESAARQRLSRQVIKGLEGRSRQAHHVCWY